MRDFELITRHVVLKSEIGVHQNYFGGYLMCELDSAGAIFATKLTKGKVVTLKFSEILFLTPIKEGTIIEIFAKVSKIGNSSLTLQLSARDGLTEHEYCTADVVFVNIDENGKPKPHNLKLQ